jgi:arylsulfatase A-like enzyme
MTSLYPTTNGVKKMGDKLPMSVMTLAENYHHAGYATFATSSVPFTGRASNLQQGFDVQHERGSIGDLGHSRAKTARTYVDRLVDWIEERDEQPFFALLHIFDPHSPFEPYRPYDSLWSSPDAAELHEADLEKVEEFDDDIRRGGDPLPDAEQFEGAGVDPGPFVEREINWYDESIRAMDVELARLFERLEDMGLAEDLLVVVVSDHGEEFLEHGRHFHGNSVYGELTNVPLMFWGPGRVPAGATIDETVQSIDVYPTLLELTGLPRPETLQGQSLVPLMSERPGFRSRPAFAARFSPKTEDPEPDEIGSFAMIDGEYRLIHNVVRPEGHPEFELYDHVADPLNLTDIASDNPDRVESMAKQMALWLQWAEANKVESDGDSAELSDDQLEQLRALGYVGDH